MYQAMYKSYYIINGKAVPFISGGKGGCFAAGTLIEIPGGTKPIEQVKVGDIVISFDHYGKISENKVTQVFEHEDDELVEISFWNGSFKITPNHWVLNENMAFTAIGNLQVDDVLVDRLGYYRPILGIKNIGKDRVYNFTVENDHTYIANDIRVHNKGGGKSAAPAVEAPNSLFSTDIFFGTLALGEGPIYRVNPNGPQDIEFNESSIDDLIKMDTDGTINTELFYTAHTTGTVTGKGISSNLSRFTGKTVTPQGLNSPINLKKGNLQSIPKVIVIQNTSQYAWDSLDFNFLIAGLQSMDGNGNVNPYSVSVKITLYDYTGTTILKDADGADLIIEKTISGKTNTNYKFSISVLIADIAKSNNGYQFRIEKTTDDSDSSKIQDVITFVGWDEVENSKHAYPRTSLLGVALKSTAEYSGSIPTITSLVKGLIIKVPSNYNQPILDTGEIDWRELETPTSGAFSYITCGYQQENPGTGRAEGYATFNVVSGYSNSQISGVSVSSRGSYSGGVVPTIDFTQPSQANAAVLATGTISSMEVASATVAVGGTGYTNGDTLTVSYGGGTATFTASVSGGVVKSVTPVSRGTWTASATTSGAKSTTVSPVGGTGCTLNVLYGVKAVTISETGNGYLPNPYNKQHSVTFSAGAAQTEANPIIYKGSWDGTFVYKWTQNPIWILYDLLTNQSYGLGIPEGNIDKFKFYKIAQYCDAVDPKTGRFIGVTGYADGTFRHKPRGKFTAVRENQIGISLGTPITERRFTCNISLNSQKQVMDIINQITAIFRGILFYSGGKISLNVDLPDEIPVAIYNETNILKNSLLISGIKESEILTGVEVSYLEPRNHSRRELIRIDDPTAISELNSIENVKSIDLPGCDRRSQAMRFGQYLLASSKYVRRKATFKTPAEGMTSTIGDVIALSQRIGGIAWGYGGRVFANATTSTGNVILEHFTSPAITGSVITGNTNPIALRIINRETERVELYICQNTYSSISSSNVNAGIDILELTVQKVYKPQTRTFASFANFTSNNVPVKGDIWSLGEVDPSNYYVNTNDKLFKIVNVERDTDEVVTITATEYVSNVYTDSDSIINYVPVKYTDTANPLVPPPAPVLNVVPRPIKQLDGSVQYDLEVYTATDTTGYPVAITTELQIAKPAEILTIQGIS